MATEHIGLEGVGSRRASLGDREFTIIRKGYNPDEVHAFLAEVEASVIELEEWALRANARLAIAEENEISKAEIDDAMIAVFDARDRVLERAHRRAERIQAEAIERATAEQEKVAAHIVAQAQREAERIVHVARTSTAPPTDDGLEQARTQADRLIEEAQAEAQRVLMEGRHEAERLIREAKVLAGAPPGGPLAVADDDDWLTIVIDDGPAERQSRYERTSAKLPSTDVDAADVYGMIERLRRRT